MKELKESKLYIMTTNKVSGVYTITNKTTDRLYIGESLDIYRRWHDEHIPQLRKNLHYNKELQKDFNKYGEENFQFEVLERYLGNDPISTKARLLILESYFITQFEKAGISLYNAENTLVEILNGNKIPEAGNTMVCAIAGVLVNYAIKECEGFVYFEKCKTLKSILLEHVTPKKESQASIIKEFEKYLEDNGSNKYQYTKVKPVNYVINGKKMRHEEYVVRDDKVKELEKMAILFSEFRNKEQKKMDMPFDKKVSVNKEFEPICDGEVRFSNLFKIFAEDGTLPRDYIYDKVREYMVGLGIISMKEMESKGVSKRVSFATEDALDKNILRIVGRNRYGDSFTYSYVFTVEGIAYMRKIFSDLDESKKVELFTYGNVA
ncbi:MAG: GIY-YIG nuclease family protein [Lachnospiraceae bacterium]|nr:GIY-YIG nuclease family protein [Lachnospiraceae bacterium]